MLALLRGVVAMLARQRDQARERLRDDCASRSFDAADSFEHASNPPTARVYASHAAMPVAANTPSAGKPHVPPGTPPAAKHASPPPTRMHARSSADQLSLSHAFAISARESAIALLRSAGGSSAGSLPAHAASA